MKLEKQILKCISKSKEPKITTTSLKKEKKEEEGLAGQWK